MTAPSEIWVLCDDASHKDAPADALRLSLGATGDSMTVEIEGIAAALTGRLRPQFADLIRIAALVLGADGAAGRGRIDDDNIDRWMRRFRIVIGVDDPSFWSQQAVQGALEETLSFLSQDSFSFEFQHRRSRPVRQLVFSQPGGEPFLPWDQVQEVALFSGGLDSFSGAADLVLTKRVGAILVSHRSSPKVLKTQTTLVKELQKVAQAEGCHPPIHVTVEVTKHDNQMRAERTQRTRSLLYAAIAGAVADLLGRSRVHMYENGVVAINLPLAGSVVGSRATRTAHPQVLLGFAKILSLIAGRPMGVENPFALMTRGEIIQGLGSTSAIQLARHTYSCAHVHKSSNMHPHCGACSQCIDRQFSFLGSGMAAHDSEDGYAIHLTNGEWTSEPARNLLLNWIAAAEKYADCRNKMEFLGSFGEAIRAVAPLMESCKMDSDTAAQAVFNLHKRHGQAVAKVLDDLCTSTAADMRRGRLKPDTLPRLLFERAGEQPPISREAKPLGPQNVLLKAGNKWRLRFRAGPTFEVPDSEGMTYLSILLGKPGVVHAPEGLVALAEGRVPNPSRALGPRAKQSVLAHIQAVEKERDEAQVFSDDEAAQRCQSEIDALRLIAEERSGGRPLAATAQSRKVEDDIRKAIASIARHSSSLGDHLVEAVHIGPALWYRRTDATWDVPYRAGSTQQAASADPQRTNEASSVNRFVKDGEYWSVSFRGVSATIRHTKGMAYLQKLFASPGTPVHTWSLRHDEEAPDAMGPDELVDDDTLKGVRSRITELTALLENESDPELREAATAELQQSQDYLKSSTMQLGKKRTSRSNRDDVQKTRETVAQAITTALRKIATALPALHDHLRDALDGPSGLRPCYRAPPIGQIWQVGT